MTLFQYLAKLSLTVAGVLGVSARLSISVYVPTSTPGEQYFEMMNGLSHVVEHFRYEYDAYIIYEIVDVSDELMFMNALSVTPEQLPEPPFAVNSKKYYATVYVEGIKVSVPVEDVPALVKEILEKMLRGEELLVGAFASNLVSEPAVA